MSSLLSRSSAICCSSFRFTLYRSSALNPPTMSRTIASAWGFDDPFGVIRPVSLCSRGERLLITRKITLMEMLP